MRERYNTIFLRDAIARKKLSAPEFAAKAKLSKFSVYRALSGGYARLKTLGKMASALGVEPKELLSEARCGE